MITLTKILTAEVDIKPNYTLFLTAEERQRSRQKITVEEQVFSLNLTRGTVLKEDDLLTNDDESIIVEIKAKEEPVITVTSQSKLDLIKAAYHLGNRHVILEVNEDYLRLSPDSVLQEMLIKLGLEIKEELTPFYPEIGAYKS
jgi:urease accessory protein